MPVGYRAGFRTGLVILGICLAVYSFSMWRAPAVQPSSTPLWLLIGPDGLLYVAPFLSALAAGIVARERFFRLAVVLFACALAVEIVPVLLSLSEEAPEPLVHNPLRLLMAAFKQSCSFLAGAFLAEQISLRKNQTPRGHSLDRD